MCAGWSRSSHPRSRRRSARRSPAASRPAVRLLGEDRLAVRALQRQAGVRDAVHRHRAVLAEVANGVAHVLGPGRAVQADNVDPQRGQRGEHGLDVRAEQHLAALGQGETEHWIGTARDLGRTPRARRARRPSSRMSCAVSMISRSAPPCTRPRLLLEDLDEPPERDLPRGSGRRWPADSRSGRSSRPEAPLAGGRARKLGRLAVDLEACARRAPTRRA